MVRKSFPQFIIISGSGKKVGKTFMSTALIRVFSAKFPLLALKISPHVHDSLGNTCLRASSEGIRIFQDLGPHAKNSGKFLEAGALQSYFMETDDGHLAEAFELFMKECNNANHPVICESGALTSLIRPGISIFIDSATDDLPKHKLEARQLADVVLPAKSFSTSALTGRVGFSDSGWYVIS
ncbi:MAG: hypothetical protein NTW16_08720 [Bacteroidetes bacterium]|nr:hypothetical protein [Bacteroidota bacterium]